MHIHIEKDNLTAKYNIEQLELVTNKGFNSTELKAIRIVIEKNLELFKEKWNEYFNN